MELTTALAGLDKAVSILQRIKKLAGMPDAKAQAAYAEQIEELTLFLAAQHSYETPPSNAHVHAALRQLSEAASRATNTKKVEILEAAFFGMFNPRFFDDGWNQILWDFAARLEYPDAVFLQKLLDFYAKRQRHQAPGMGVNVDSLDFTCAQRLLDLGLLVEVDRLHHVVMVAPTGACERLREFLWSSNGAAEMPGTLASDETR